MYYVYASGTIFFTTFQKLSTLGPALKTQEIKIVSDRIGQTQKGSSSSTAVVVRVVPHTHYLNPVVMYTAASVTALRVVFSLVSSRPVF